MTSPDVPQGAHPPVQLSQFNSHTASSADHDINLFRGTVSFAVPLVSLPGRSGLNLDLTASYNSQVAQQVQETNLTAPTGILGLGWSLGLDHIAATYGTAGVRDSATYYAFSGGIQSRLHPTEQRWKRADLPLSHTAHLTEGPLDPSVIAALSEQGLVVDAAARVHVETPDQAWRVVDHILEFSLHIERRADILQVFDGGTAYELEQFDFSRIRYYAPFEKWVITHPNGQTTVFGGGVAQNANEHAISTGSSITWGVCWQTFSGPSTVTHDPSGQKRCQQQYPTAWYVSARIAPTTERCHYTYTPVEQCVGDGGLPYTKAIYLHRMTDELWQKVTLTYAEKLYNVSDYQPREYHDPHKIIPNTIPDAYQSRYETLYLDSLRVTDAGGSPLETVTFTYDVQVFGDVPSTAHPSRHGDLAKRVLTSITRMRGNGQTLPPLCFSYHKAPALNPGALATKTAPEGVVTRYDYQKVNLPQPLRSVNLPSPLSNATPRVWFGSNYTVVIWVNALQWTLNVSTWVGRWVQWTLPSGPMQQSIDPHDLNVMAETDFFTVDASTTNQETSLLLLFHKDPEVLGGWLGTHDTPRILSTPHRQVVAGACFVALTHSGSTIVDRYTWSPDTRQWASSSLAAPTDISDPERYHIALAGGGNSLATLYYQRRGTPETKDTRLSFSCVDADHRWHLGETRSIPNLGVVETDLHKNLSLTHTGWCLAILGLVTEASDEAIYDLLLFTWTQTPSADPGPEPDIRYAWTPPFQKRFSVRKAPNGTLSTPATLTVTPTGMIACGPILLRYNGNTWLENTTLAL
ncbi:MAG: hypothetical protein EB075_09790, partial [Bacteroidetes bacterium]|nr:hypothetical protein [Bacteroidota bacterium]